MKSDIERYDLIPFMNLATRVEMIKMNLLPRLLYLFTLLPVEMIDKDFTEWDKLISRFMWEGR